MLISTKNAINLCFLICSLLFDVALVVFFVMVTVEDILGSAFSLFNLIICFGLPFRLVCMMRA